MSQEAPTSHGDLEGLKINRPQESFAPRRKKSSGWFALLVLAAAAIFWFFLRERWSFPQVRVGRASLVSSEHAATSLTVSGYLIPRRKASVGAKVSGKLERLLVDEGSVVKAGDLLAEIDDRDYGAKRNEARANLADAAREMERQKNLFASGAGTQQKIDEQQTRLEVFRAQLELAEINLQNTKIYAPFDGIVIQKQAEIGEMISPGLVAGAVYSGAIAVIADKELEVEADINESNFSKISPNQDAEIVVDALPDRKYRGKIRLIEPKADRQKAIIQAKVSILNPDADLRPDMGAKVSFLSVEAKKGEFKSSVQVPSSAVVERNGAKCVFLLEGKRAKIRSVEVGASDGAFTPVLQGLGGGEEVLLSPSAEIQDETQVQVIP